MTNPDRRSWQVIKLGEDDYAAHGILVQGPRCDDEKLVPLADVMAALREKADATTPWSPDSEARYFHAAADFNAGEFGES